MLFHYFPVLIRANRRKKLAKALERQARKLRAKGITVDLESLRADYLSQHHVTSESDLEDDDPQIDVVGEDSCEKSNDAIHPLLMAAAAVDRRIGGGGGNGGHGGGGGHGDSDGRRADTGGDSDSQPSPTSSTTSASSYKRNPFSIEALLYNPA